MNIGDKIKELREKNGKTQLDIAKFLGITYQTVYKYEKGIAIPPAEALVKIAEYFNVTTDYLLGKTDIPNNNLHQAASSDIDLAKLAKLDKNKKEMVEKTANDMINMFYDEFGNKD